MSNATMKCREVTVPAYVLLHLLRLWISHFGEAQPVLLREIKAAEQEIEMFCLEKPISRNVDDESRDLRHNGCEIGSHGRFEALTHLVQHSRTSWHLFAEQLSPWTQELPPFLHDVYTLQGMKDGVDCFELRLAGSQDHIDLQVPWSRMMDFMTLLQECQKSLKRKPSKATFQWPESTSCQVRSKENNI